jgi:peptide/nickel transport system ATP-binding protein
VQNPSQLNPKWKAKPVTATLLEIQDLVVDYAVPNGRVRAVDHISFDVRPGEIVGLAGESGCGKSTAAHAILRLLRPPARIAGGRILFQGQDLVAMSPAEVRQFRWNHISIVLQSAMNALNPVMTVGNQFADTLRAHDQKGRRLARERASEMLTLVEIDPRHLKSYPHELSGGMRQRIVIAMALALNPELIVMDEPTTGLDVVVQRDILQQIQDLQKKLGFAVLFITHDLSLLVEFSERIAIMYAAEIVEFTASWDLFRAPLHPYTVGLMRSFPSLTGPRSALAGIPGTPPNLLKPPRGCRFFSRCSVCPPMAERVKPLLREVQPGHLVACLRYDGDQYGR